jgi:hypothetical protein
MFCSRVVIGGVSASQRREACDRAGENDPASENECSGAQGISFEGNTVVDGCYSAASLCPNLALSLWISSSAASAITVPGGKIASAPAL